MFSNSLSAAEAERLAILAEELGEAVKAIGKILRHGYESYNPNIAGSETNRSDLERELGDVHFAVKQMAESGDIKITAIFTWAERKAKAIGKYLHHQNADSQPRGLSFWEEGKQR